MGNRKNPYIVLLEQITAFCFSLAHRHTVSMFCYPKPRLNEGWSLTDLYERTKAASQLGYDVVMDAKDDGLHVRYVKRVDVPYEWQ